MIDQICSELISTLSVALALLQLIPYLRALHLIDIHKSKAMSMGRGRGGFGSWALAYVIAFPSLSTQERSVLCW